MGDESMDFIECLDDREMRFHSDWGAGLLESLDHELLPDEIFAANRVENLVAGFSNVCQLDCPFCGVHKSRRLGIPSEELEIPRLIELIRRHKEQTGYELGHFRIGNTGEPLIHKEFTNLVTGTEDSVNYFSVISNMNIRNPAVLDFVAGHEKIDWINVSCDAGDEGTYAKIREGGDFNLVFQNARFLIGAGKRLVLNAVLFKENEESLLNLPAILAREGFRELHVFYPLTNSGLLAQFGLHKHTLSEFRDFFLKLRGLCESLSLPLSTDGWVFRPEMIGTIPQIDTREMFEAYTHHPCDALYHLILYPNGTFNNCSILDSLGPADERANNAFHSRELIEMLNLPKVLTMRKLHVLGYFPPACKRICGKQDHPRSEKEACLILKAKYPSRDFVMSVDEFADRLRNTDKTFVIRALSPAMRSILNAYPGLHNHLELIVDRDSRLSYGDYPVISPEALPAHAGDRKLVVLIASDRGAVLTSVIEQVDHYSEVYKLIVRGSDPRDFVIQRLLP